MIGVRQATWTVDVFTVAKLLPLRPADPPRAASGEPRGARDARRWRAPDWTQAILLLMFAYGGFEAPLIPAGEAKDPRRDTGFALLVAPAA